MSRQQTVELTAEVQEAVRLAKTELGEMLEGQKKIVQKIGHAVAADPSLDGKLEHVCVTIKHLLAEEIAAGKIALRTIEDACPPEWKNASKSEAGAMGGAKTAAGRSQRTTTDDDVGISVSAAEFRELKAEVEKLKELKPLAKEAVRSAIEDGEYMKIHKSKFTPLAEAVGLVG